MRKALYIFLLFANLAVAFILLLAYLSTHISPAKIWILAFIGLIYPYVLTANILFVILWTLKWKREALISLAIILLGWNHLIDYIPFRFPKSYEKAVKDTLNYKDLKILSYNVRAFNIYEWLDDRATSNNIFNLIRSERPDIVCMQEYYTGKPLPNNPEEIKQAFKETPYSHIHYAYLTGKATGYGIATYSRYPIVKKGVVRFLNTNNISIYSDILIEKDTIRVYNNHLQSLNFQKSNYNFLDSIRFRYNEKQMSQVRDISRRLRDAFIKRSVQVDSVSFHIKSSPFPVIVCGDFNDTPVSYTYRKMRAGLKDSFVSTGEGFGSTYLGVFPSFRIDYIFHSPRFTTIDFERIRAKLSDHYPIICHLRYSPSGE